MSHPTPDEWARMSDRERARWLFRERAWGGPKRPMLPQERHKPQDGPQQGTDDGAPPRQA